MFKIPPSRLLSGNAGATLLVLLIAIGSAHGQDNEQDRLRPIKVTAQKREQALNDVAVTVNVFDAKMLEKFGVETAQDLDMITPGLTVTDVLPNGVPVFTIRGVGFADFSTSASSTVGLYFDEVNLPYSVMSRGMLFDIDRVEVLKGPQGDLYGKNTTGGQINFIHNKPTDEFEINTSGSVSNYNAYNIASSVSGGLTDNIQARIAGKYTLANSGWQQSLSNKNNFLGNKNEVAVRAMLNYDASDDLSVLLKIQYSLDRSDNIAPTPFGESPLYTENNGSVKFLTSIGNNKVADWSEDARPGRNNSMVRLSAKLDWDLQDRVNISSITGYEYFARSERFDISGVSFADGDAFDVSSIGVFSQELRFSSLNSDRLYWSGGLFYSRDDIDEQYLLNANGAAIVPYRNETMTKYKQSSQSMAVFARAEWEFIDNLRLNLGGRYTHEDRSWTGCTHDTDGSLGILWNWVIAADKLKNLPRPGSVDDRNNVLAEGGCGTYNDLAGTTNYGEFAPFSANIATDRFMWKVMLDYTLPGDILLYGSIAEGFKSGGFNGAPSLMHSSLQPYQAEILLAYEIGVKATAFSGALRLDAATFFYDYTDKQEGTVSVTPIGNIAGLTNIPKSRVMGVELDMNLFLTENFAFGLNAMYLNTAILKYDAICETQSDVCPKASAYPDTYTYDASGYRLPNSPEFQATMTASYIWPVSDRFSVAFSGEMPYKSNNDGSIQPLISGYTLINARIEVFPYHKRWNVTIWGRNIFDADYWVSSSTSLCCLTRTYGQPATYGVTASINF